MIVQHWLISEGIFSAQIDMNAGDVLNLGPITTGAAAEELDYSTITSPMISTRLYTTLNIFIVGFPLLPILLTMFLGALMIIAVVASGFRTLANPTPVASSCSLAMAAACHRPEGGRIAAYLPVRWGEVNSEGYVGHCCFTSHPVWELTVGKLSAEQDCRSKVSTGRGIAVSRWKETS